MRLRFAVVLVIATLMSVASLATRPVPKSSAGQVAFFATTGAGNGLSSLYRIDPMTGAGTLIGPTGYRGVSGTDFMPGTSILFGVGRRPSDNVPVLLKIDKKTGAATEVGPTGSGLRFSDITFRHLDSTLFAWSVPDRLATIDVATGRANVFGVDVVGLGDATAFDANDVLYHTATPDGSTTLQTLGIVNKRTGEFTAIAPMIFFPPIDSLTAISAMKFNPSSGAHNGIALETGIIAKLAIIDTRTGYVRSLGTTVTGLDSLDIGLVPSAAPAAVPQVFQNPGAVAIVNARPARTPTPLIPSAPSAVAGVAPVMPVLRPPSTGDAGLKVD